jgi:putative nucleotidyltransferase with HDIG domain
LEENVRKLESAKKTLHSVLRKVSRGISSMDNIDSFLELIMETVAEAFSAKIGVLLLKDEKKEELRVKIIHGGSQPIKNKFKAIPISDDNFGWVIREKKPLVVSRLQFDAATARVYAGLLEAPMLCAPLYFHEKVLGLMCVGGRSAKNDFKEDEISLINNLALQTAVAIENAKLNENAEKTYFETISALALAVEARDKYSRGHLDRVAEYAIKIARQLNLSEEDINILRDGARLHDVGKIGIPDEILKKPGGLTPEERDMMRKHTEIGENIIKPISSLRKLCDVVRHHHELLDGSGYPDGLRGDEISLLTRILTVADIFDALTTNRSYRAAFSFADAKKELLKMDAKLDQNVVKVFLAV